MTSTSAQGPPLLEDIYTSMMGEGLQDSRGTIATVVPKKKLVLDGHYSRGAMASVVAAYDFYFSDGLLSGMTPEERAQYMGVYTYGEPRSLEMGVGYAQHQS